MSHSERPTGRALKVFLSSTFDDLAPFRAAVLDALRKIPEHYLPWGMEDVAAQTPPPLDVSLEGLRSCDVYVGIIGWRYGSIPPKQTESFVELEYRAAVAEKKNVMLFFAAEVLKPQRNGSEDDAVRIAGFRQELRQAHTTALECFKTPDELAKQVLTALRNLKDPKHPVERTRDSYLRWVERMNEELTLVGLKQGTTVPVKLQEVYVALRGDRIGAQELLESQQLLNDRVEELEHSGPGLTEEERQRLLACVVRESPHMLSLYQRDRVARAGAGAFRHRGASSVTLAEAFRRERWLVILGDPGSGKTTLGRWLALHLAPARREPAASVEVPASHVNPETPYDHRLISLGPARLPILVRVAEFANELARLEKEGEPLTLVDWLPKATWNRQPPSDGGRIPPEALDRLFRESLKNGDAVLILDGLDEITDGASRQGVVEAIREFCRDFVPPIDSASASALHGPPVECGGNQLVVTSRIAGYHSSPLAMTGVTTVVIEPMRRVAVEHFCTTWMTAVQHKLLGNGAEAEETAHRLAGRLIAAIFAKDSLAEIATNPLLVTNIASLFLRRGEKLPGSRAELYKTLIELLISGWRHNSLELEEVLYVLEPVAAEIHEKYPTGLIEQADLENMVARYLAQSRGTLAEGRVSSDVRRFLNCLNDEVGLIAGRGERLYGFLHLTFQEYLAGRFLLRDRPNAAKTICTKLYDPRWREPILLAIGHAGREWPSKERERLFEELLAADDPLDAFLPRVALLLSEAIAELPELPPPSFRQLVRRLLRSYAARSTRQFPALETRIERAFLQLRRFGQADVMDEILAETIAGPGDVHLAPAAASLVRRNGWLAPLIVRSLHEGVERDSAEWDWPIERALFEIASPSVSDAAPVVESVDARVQQAIQKLKELETGELLETLASEVPRLTAETAAQAAELEELERLLADAAPEEEKEERERLKKLQAGATACKEAIETLADLRSGGVATRERLARDVDKERDALEQQLYANPRGYDRLLSRYAIAAAGEAEFELRDRLRVTADPSIVDLPVRRFLEGPDGQNVRYDYRQLAVLAVVYGGYSNHRANEVVGEYYEIARFLQRADTERELLLDTVGQHYVARFGNGGDIIYRMAKYLDERMNGRLSLAYEQPQFSPTAVYRSSPLDRLLLRFLNSRAPAGEWIAPLWEAWKNEPSLRGRADAIAALVALGEDVVPALRTALANLALRPAAEGAITNLRRLTVFLSDPVFRARKAVVEDLKSLNEEDPYRWIDIIDTALLELARSADAPANFTALMENAPALYWPVLYADWWYAMFSGGDDRAQNMAKPLQQVPEADDLVRILAGANRSPSLRAGRLPFQWLLQPIEPKLIDDPTDVPIEALEAIEALNLGAIHPDFTGKLERIALDRFRARVELNADLAFVLAAFQLRTAVIRSAAQLFPVLKRNTDPFETLIKRLAPVADPYFKVRTMADLLPFFPAADRTRLVSECLRECDKVKDAFRRSRLFEMLLPRAGEKERERLLDLSDTAARKIKDPEQRARTLGRLARWQGPREQARWIDAIRSAVKIPFAYHKSETLRILASQMPQDEIIRASWQKAHAGLPTAEAKARALNRRATLLIRQPPVTLQQKISVNAEVWAPVLFSSAAQETLAELRPAELSRDHWLRLASDPGNSTALEAVLALEGEEGIFLTVEAAQAVEALMAAGRTDSLHRLLPLLQSPTSEARRFVDGWLQASDPSVAAHGALLIAENGRRINDETFPHLLGLLDSSADRSRCRAKLVLLSSNWSAEKEEPCLNVSELGVPLCDAIARLAVRTADSDVRVNYVCGGMLSDFVHDDPEALHQWIARVRTNGEADKEACTNLKGAIRFTAETWPIFLDTLANEDELVQNLLLQALAKMLHIKGRVNDGLRREVVRVLRTLDVQRFAGVRTLIEPEQVIADVCIAVANEGFPAVGTMSTISRVEELLRKSTTTLADVLRTVDDTALLEGLNAIGRTRFALLNGSEPEAATAAATIVANEASFPILVEWLTARLAQDSEASFWLDVTGSLLTVTGRAVRFLPAIYAKRADGPRLELLLARAARSRLLVNARRAAIVLLGRLNRISSVTVDTLPFALRDDPFVQDAAIEAIEHLAVPADVRTPLLRALYSESTGVALGAAQMLAVISRDERTSNEVRNEILRALVGSLEGSGFRGIYRLGGTGSGLAERVALTRLGALDQELYRAILQVAGLAESAY